MVYPYNGHPSWTNHRCEKLAQSSYAVDTVSYMYVIDPELRWTTTEMDGQDTVKVLVSSRNRTSERRTSWHHCRRTAKTASQSHTASTYEY